MTTIESSKHARRIDDLIELYRDGKLLPTQAAELSSLLRDEEHVALDERQAEMLDEVLSASAIACELVAIPEQNADISPQEKADLWSGIRQTLPIRQRPSFFRRHYRSLSYGFLASAAVAAMLMLYFWPAAHHQEQIEQWRLKGGFGHGIEPQLFVARAGVTCDLISYHAGHALQTSDALLLEYRLELPGYLSLIRCDQDSAEQVYPEPPQGPEYKPAGRHLLRAGTNVVAISLESLQGEQRFVMINMKRPVESALLIDIAKSVLANPDGSRLPAGVAANEFTYGVFTVELDRN